MVEVRANPPMNINVTNCMITINIYNIIFICEIKLRITKDRKYNKRYY